MMNSEQSIPCPVCETKIPFDTKLLLQGSKFSCPKCGAGIGLANESMDTVEKSMEKLQELKNQAGKTDNQ